MLVTARDSLVSLVILFTVVFFVIRIVPGDPARLLAGVSASEDQMRCSGASSASTCPSGASTCNSWASSARARP
jgi:hypothetical protein